MKDGLVLSPDTIKRRKGMPFSFRGCEWWTDKPQIERRANSHNWKRVELTNEGAVVYFCENCGAECRTEANFDRYLCDECCKAKYDICL